MKISVAIKDLINCPQGFQELRALRLPAKLAYAIAKLARQIDPILDDYRKLHNDTLAEHTKGMDPTKPLAPAVLAAFQDKVKELQETTEELDFLYPTRIPLKIFDGREVSSDMFIQLHWLLVDDEAPAPCEPSSSSTPPQ